LEDGLKRQFLEKAKQSASRLVTLSIAASSVYFRSVGTFLTVKTVVESIKLSPTAHNASRNASLKNHIRDLKESQENLRTLGDMAYDGSIGSLLEEIEDLPTTIWRDP